MTTPGGSQSEIGDLSGISFPSSVEYTLHDELGRGGMGIVFLGERNACGVKDQVVLKTVISISPKYIDDLKKEANIATGLRHENIVKTYGLESIPAGKLPTTLQESLDHREQGAAHTVREIRTWEPEDGSDSSEAQKQTVEMQDPPEGRDIFLICMDYVKGLDLDDLHGNHIDRNLLLPVPIAAFIISRMCRALGYAHPRIIHRDISPGNILINNLGVCQLTDFGVAVESDEPVNLIVGKFRYMSPEQIFQEEVDGRSDLFSLGMVAYEILTGIPYFKPPSNLDMAGKLKYVRHLHDDTPPPPAEVRSDIPEILSQIVMKMIRPDPGERFEDAASAGNVLEQQFLYAEGFGPTNNSLRSYMDLFESGFEDYSSQQLSQLRFMQKEEKGYSIKRKFDEEAYSEEGLDLLHDRGLEPA